MAHDVIPSHYSRYKYFTQAIIRSTSGVDGLNKSVQNMLRVIGCFV